MAIEQAVRPSKHKRSLPDWVQAAHDDELKRIRLIACPVARRLAEIEEDEKLDRIKAEILGDVPCF